jgi:hypothetical protein
MTAVKLAVVEHLAAALKRLAQSSRGFKQHPLICAYFKVYAAERGF